VYEYRSRVVESRDKRYIAKQVQHIATENSTKEEHDEYAINERDETRRQRNEAAKRDPREHLGEILSRSKF